MVHTWATDAAQTEALAAHLGPDQPVLALAAPATGDPMPVVVADWVERARTALDGLALGAPLRIAGFSFGGVVALELARGLLADGVAVAWLGLIDTVRPKRKPSELGAFLRYHVPLVLERPEPAERRAEAIRLARERLPVELTRMRARLGRPLLAAGIRRPPPPVVRPVVEPERRAIWTSYVRYQPEWFDHPVTLFTGASSRARAGGDPSLGWARYLRAGFEVVPVEGAHLELFTPANIHSVGSAVADRLDRLDRLSGGS